MVGQLPCDNDVCVFLLRPLLKGRYLGKQNQATSRNPREYRHSIALRMQPFGPLVRLSRGTHPSFALFAKNLQPFARKTLDGCKARFCPESFEQLRPPRQVNNMCRIRSLGSKARGDKRAAAAGPGKRRLLGGARGKPRGSQPFFRGPGPFSYPTNGTHPKKKLGRKPFVSEVFEGSGPVQGPLFGDKLSWALF